MSWFFKLARSATWLILVIWFRFDYEGKEKIPKAGSYILACNHVSYFDPLVLAYGIKRMIRFLSKSELSGNAVTKKLFEWIGTVPVNRGAGDTGIIDRCVELAGQGYLLGIFPEGTRYKEGNPGKPKSGMIYIAKHSKVPIIPCAIRYESPMRFRSRVIVKYGDPISYEALGLEDDSPRVLKKATKMVWDRVLNLLGVVVDEAKDTNC